MVKFLYFEDREGGVDYFEVTQDTDLRRLLGWMDDHCYHQDRALLTWMQVAEVGDYADHRLGTAVRIK